MGHMSSKDAYRKLGDKIDNLTARTPWSETLHEILKELYSAGVFESGFATEDYCGCLPVVHLFDSR